VQAGPWWTAQNGLVTDPTERAADLPRKALARSLRLASLPVGLAGRTALGLGKRLGGKPAELYRAGRMWKKGAPVRYPQPNDTRKEHE